MKQKPELLVIGYFFDINELKEYFEEQAAKAGDKFSNFEPFEDFLDRTMPDYGLVNDGKFVILRNDYAEENNPLSSYAEAINEHYEDSKIGKMLYFAPSLEIPAIAESGVSSK